MQLKPNHIHVWTINLAISPDQEINQFDSLTPDEQQRAKRFLAPIHRKRFIAARYALRNILGQYLSTPPENVSFIYTEHGKPFLSGTMQEKLQFNLAHTYDIAVCVITLDHAIGVDIEKIVEKNDLAIAERFFSREENRALSVLPPDEQTIGFYRLWSKKEALVKAVGKGLSISLSSFSVSTNTLPEMIVLENKNWSLVTLDILTHFQAALATDQEIEKISYFSHQS